MISIFESVSNEGVLKSGANSETLKFFYVPLMFPQLNAKINKWIWTTNGGTEIRLSLATGNNEIEQLILDEIKKDTKKQGNIKIAPLIIGSLTAVITSGSGEPVFGVHPYRFVNPTQLNLIFRFQCTSAEHAQHVIEKLLDGDYDIQLALYYVGILDVTMNMIKISAETLKTVVSSTTADGGNTTAQYIHRKQASNFVSGYMANVKKTIYIENALTDTTQLIAGLEDQFKTLIQQAKTQLEAKLFDQLWSSSDLNPDIMRSDLNKIFTYNKTATDQAQSSDTFFNYNEKEAQASDTKGKIQIGWKLFGASAEASHAQSSQSESGKTTHDIVSSKTVKDFLAQQSIETEWTGEKWQPKSFTVNKLTDITNRLQVALVAKQLFAEKSDGAQMKYFNIMNVPVPNETGPYDEYTKFEWRYCNTSPHPDVEIINIDLTPTPLNYPGHANFVFIANIKRQLIKCYIADGQSIGSCEYNDLCSILGFIFQQFNPADCSSNLKKYDIDCTCPFNIQAQHLNINETFRLPDIQNSAYKFIASGNFYVKIETSDTKGPLVCLELRYKATNK
ncbi:unnamed protein product [Didymodactylos carnosus]|uniref:Uncharacterized protein n=1 Tax=Didymodactylos carnosus TaxID=1234261 RepID=A0A8S2EFF3_9BILA|nr:unnamed protein product [Didymodactylos carnosus]CAF3922637.1 unnamed protein product [Didymodactylos carnosus]